MLTLDKTRRQISSNN